MAFEKSVNEFLQEDITRLNYTLIPPGFHGDGRIFRHMQSSLSRIIDDLGQQSARAQGLNKVITTADKMRNTPANTLYLLKDAKANRGSGLVIGFLKVGQKKLFLYNARAEVVETEPLCVLDFFVLPEYQRHGNGKRLFDHMLKEEGALIKHLAIDGPSEKMKTFMKTKYGLVDLVQQSNNFAVVPEFFKGDQQQSRAAAMPPDRSTPVVPVVPVRTTPVVPVRTTPVVPVQVGRYSARRPPSTIGAVIHGAAGGAGVAGGAGGAGGADGAGGAGGGVGAGHRSTNGSVGGELPSPTLGAEAERQAEVLQTPVPASPPSRPSSLHIDATPAPGPAPALSSLPAAGGDAARDTQLTDQGYFDIKFYHNKLW